MHDFVSSYKFTHVHMSSHEIISHVVLGKCNYSHSSKGELFCIRDKRCSPFNECTTLSPPTNSHTASLLPKRLLLWKIENEIEINCIQQVLNVWMITWYKESSYNIFSSSELFSLVIYIYIYIYIFYFTNSLTILK